MLLPPYPLYQSLTLVRCGHFLQSVLSASGAVWADIFLTKNGASPNPKDATHNAKDVHHIRKRRLPGPF